ncbi:hypothetical protein T05_6317 [Trichinella murrelli]|uniref:Uncharacterized protein n=1 Tax=Trichinella murrelli TaxID=144512 RepID=A0A0V0T3V0_9BILA|nr:hypothetical protein T05_6317 [Trichinella murrelli]
MAIVAAWKLHMELHTAPKATRGHGHLPISLGTSHGHYLQSCTQG